MRFADSSSALADGPAQGAANGTSELSPGPAAAPPPALPAGPQAEEGVDLGFLDPPVDAGELGRIAHYRVLSIIGVGGMGVVLRGEDTHLRRPVAIKVMRKEYVESYASRERFLQEARVAAAVESENIVTIYQVGMHNDVPYLAMQYLHGEALDDRLNRQAPLPIPFALLVSRQTAAGLADAHATGLVHRDVKPANIWLETDPASGKFRRARLLDFGLARIVDSKRHLTSTGVVVGTPQYMSPEQAFGSHVDGRADLFSLGAVMYAMFTGRLPFEGETSAAVLLALVSHVPPRASKINAQTPAEVDDLIARLLAKEPDGRPASADEVVEVLDGVLIEFSATTLGRTSGALGYPIRGDTYAGARAGYPHPSHPAPEPQENTLIGSTPTVTFPPAGTAAPAAPSVPAVPSAAPVPAAVPPSDARLLASPPATPPQRTVTWLTGIGWAALIALTGLLASGAIGPRPAAAPVAPPAELRVGVLYAKGGSMAALEQSLADAAMLAVDEVNRAGGVLGRKVVPIELDAGRTPEEYSRQAEVLVKERGVSALFGCPAACDRRTLRPAIERFNALLFCTGPHEGMEQSARIVYVGPTASQSTLPAVQRLLALGHRRFFVVGKDNVFSRAMGAVVQDALKAVPGALLAGETYLPVGSKDFAPVLAELRAKQPEVVVNAMQGGGSVVFVQQMRAAVPTLKGRILHLQHLEDHHLALEPAVAARDWISCSYLSHDPAGGGDDFAARFLARYGANRAPTDAMAAAYAAVHLWAKAAEAAGSTEPDAVLAALPRVEWDGPFGTMRAVETGRHFRFRSILGEFAPDGTVRAVHRTEPLEPHVYPTTRAPADWDRYLRQLYFRWGERWRGPDAK